MVDAVWWLGLVMGHYNVAFGSRRGGCYLVLLIGTSSLLLPTRTLCVHGFFSCDSNIQACTNDRCVVPRTYADAEDKKIKKKERRTHKYLFVENIL